MKSSWTKSAIAAAALMCVGAAHAYNIDFESLDTSGLMFGAPLLVDGDVMFQGNYFINTQDAFGGGGLVGQISQGSDPSTCLNGTCPSGDSSTFLSVFNDGIVHWGLDTQTKTVFNSLQAAYIGTPGAPAGSTVYLVIEADRDDGSFAANYYPLSSTGSFLTITATTPGTSLGGTGTLTSGNVTDMFAYGYFCNGSTGSCSRFSTDQAQFAFDNIKMDVSAVPEPSAWLLMAGGLGAVGAIARRRRAA